MMRSFISTSSIRGNEVGREKDTKIALKLDKTLKWFNVTTDNFQWRAIKSDIPWPAIKPHLDDTMDPAHENFLSLKS